MKNVIITVSLVLVLLFISVIFALDAVIKSNNASQKAYNEFEIENNGFTLDVKNLVVVDGLSAKGNRIHLTNGDVLINCGNYCYKELRSKGFCENNPLVDVYLPNIKIGDLIYVSTSGESYRKVIKKEIAVDTVKVISFHDFHIAESAVLNGNYTSNAWALLIGGKSKQSANLHAEYHGEDSKVIANIIFTNGKHVTLLIEDDPIWLDVTSGTKIRHYQIVGQNIYEPIF